ncbi:RTC4-like domain-containing protein [Cryomyces antarcticus]
MSSEPRNFMNVDEEMGDFRPQKRAKTGYGRSSSGNTYNIHAGFSQAKKPKQPVGYGTTDHSGVRDPSIKPLLEPAHEKNRAVFRKPPSGFQIHADSSSQPGPSPPDSKFRTPPSLDDADLSSDEFNGRNTRAAARDRRRAPRNPLLPEIPDVNFRSTRDLLDKLDVRLDDSGVGSNAFKTYDLGIASTRSSSPLSSPPSSEALDHRAEHDDLDLPPVSPYTSKVECPICKEWIDRSCMEDFEAAYTRGKVMNVRTQTRFCRAHKRAGALATWQTRGYPKIDWDNLETRLRRHHPRLEAVLKQREPSFYRNRLETKLNSGAGRIVEKGIDEMDEFVPGYYGSKGARLMTDSIMAAFSRTLRRLAVSDRLVSAIGVSGGVSGYVQAVLVPELAMSLVKEDLRLTDDDDVRAREVLAESAEVGELVNEEEVERVRSRSRLGGANGVRGEEWVELELGGEEDDDGWDAGWRV